MDQGEVAIVCSRRKVRRSIVMRGGARQKRWNAKFPAAPAEAVQPAGTETMSRALIVERRTPLPVSPEEAFAWLGRAGAFVRLVPPWHHVEVLQQLDRLENGARIRFRLHLGPFAILWTAEHRDVEEGREFTDFQVTGPFDRWVHVHRFEPAHGGTAILHDRIQCDLPLGVRLGRARLARELERVLAYRHAVTAADLAMHQGTAARPRLNIAVTGASGLIGSILIPALTAGGHRVTRVVRGSPRADEIGWEPLGIGLDPAALHGVDALVHLAGENIAGSRWTAAHKRRVLESRRRGTRALAEAASRAANGPRVLVSASAIGYYGDRGDENLTETSPAGTGFLPEVVTAWEEGTRPAAEAGVRVVCLRIGLFLTPRGGLLQRLLPPFRLGLGGRLGSGSQWMSCVSADDLLGAFHHALTVDGARGPLNGVGLEPVTNAQFTRKLGASLRRPAIFAVPAAALRLALGQMADEAILASTRVLPRALIETGYRFRHPTAQAALSHVLGVSAARTAATFPAA